MVGYARCRSRNTNIYVQRADKRQVGKFNFFRPTVRRYLRTSTIYIRRTRFIYHRNDQLMGYFLGQKATLGTPEMFALEERSNHKTK